MKRFKIFKMV